MARGGWSDGANWSSGSAPEPGDDLVFPNGPLGLHATNDLPAGTSFASITVAGAGYTLDGNAIRLAGDLTITATGAGPAIAFPITLASSVMIANGGTGTSTTTFSAPDAIDLDSYTLTVGGSGKTTFSGTLSGAGSLVHGDGIGEVVLAKDNTYAGTTTINAGSVTIRAPKGLGSSAAGTIVQGTGMLRIMASGTITVDEPLTLATTASTSFGNISGTTTWNGPITLGANALIYASTPLTIAGPISGPYEANFSPLDSLTLTGTNTYSGGTVVSSGNLTVAGPASLSSGPVKTWLQASLTVAPGTYANALTIQGSTYPRGGLRTPAGTTEWSGPIDMMSGDSAIETNGVLILSGGIGGNGGFVKRGAGDVWLVSAGTYIGGTNVAAGTLTCAVAGCLPDGRAFDVNGTFHLAAGLAETVGSLLSSSGTGLVIVGSGSTLTTAGDWGSSEYGGVITGPGNMVFAGLSGRKYLAGASNHTGTTTIQSQTVNVYGSVVSPIAVLDGARLGLTNDAHVGPVTSTGGTIATILSWKSTSTSGSLLLDARSTFEVHLASPDAADQGRLIVDGTARLGSATLRVLLGFAPTIGDAFVIIDNDGVDPVVAAFAGLAEGAAFNVGSTGFKISYVGGDGNDVTLTIVPKVVDAEPDAGHDAGSIDHDDGGTGHDDGGGAGPDASDAAPPRAPSRDAGLDATVSDDIEPSALAVGGSGCGCRVSSPGPLPSAVFVVPVAAVVAALRRRRRARPFPHSLP